MHLDCRNIAAQQVLWLRDNLCLSSENPAASPHLLPTGDPDIGVLPCSLGLQDPWSESCFCLQWLLAAGAVLLRRSHMACLLPSAPWPNPLRKCGITGWVTRTYPNPSPQNLFSNHFQPHRSPHLL